MKPHILIHDIDILRDLIFNNGSKDILLENIDCFIHKIKTFVNLYLKN